MEGTKYSIIRHFALRLVVGLAVLGFLFLTAPSVHARTSLSRLQAQINALQTQINALETNKADQADIDALQTQIDGLQAQIDALDGAIDLSKISLRTCTNVFTCFCLENERVLGGGAECELPFLGIHLRNSSPIVESYDDGTPHEGWFAECTTGQDTPFAPSTTRVVCIAP